MPLLPAKTSLTILFFAIFAFVLANNQAIAPLPLVSVIDFQPRPGIALPLPETVRTGVAVTARIEPSRAHEVFEHLSSPQLLDPTHAMNAFYSALRRTESGQGVTRILHYGDSPVTADSITADMRSLLQERFGNAGHGFILASKPWAWYGHRAVDLHGSGWHAEPATQQDRARDGLQGLGGVSFEGGPGAYSTIRLDGEHDRVEVSYVKKPQGGVFSVRAEDQLLGTVDTADSTISAGWADFAMPANAHEIRIEVESGAVRLFGLSFEKGARGVIYNSLGLNGGQVQVVVRYFDRAHWAEQLRHQQPNLVVVNYGTNESVYPKYLDTFYPGELRAVIQRIKDSVPEASILIMSPMDRGERGSDGQIATLPAVPRIVQIQRRVAAETGCAFFNTFEAMGGAGTMARWYQGQPRLVTADFMHPFPAGARKIAMLLNDALMSGYRRFHGSPRPIS